MTREVDENEHSIEMQLPYIAHLMKGRACTLVPIMVGATSPEKEAEFARVLAPFFDDPKNFFVISSDFCHWGERFDYTEYDPARGEIWQSIEVRPPAARAVAESAHTRA
jgi:AmmeMemoRadiSam system protein B